MGKHVWNDTKAAHLLSCFERWSTNKKDKLAIDPNNLDKKYLTGLQTSKEHSQYFGGNLSYETFRKHFKTWSAKFFTDQASRGKRRKDLGGKSLCSLIAACLLLVATASHENLVLLP